MERKYILATVFVCMAFVLCSSAVFAKVQDQIQTPDQDQIQKQVGQPDFDKSVGDIKTYPNPNPNPPISLKGDDHRSAVATFVQNLLKVADDDTSTIGEKVREVARVQNENKEKEAKAIDAIRERSRVRTFLFGTDYKNIGELRSTMVKTQNEIRELKDLLSKETSDEVKTQLQAHIQTLEQELAKIESFIKAHEDKFSLFGWFAKWMATK